MKLTKLSELKISNLLMLSVASFGFVFATSAAGNAAEMQKFSLHPKANWSQTPVGMDLEPIRITNRAQCALDSESPTRSAFLILDGYNAGKLTYALARNVGENPDEFSKEGMREFRLAVTELTLDIIDRVRTGRLPLLPMDYSESKLRNYNNLVKKCGTKTYCDDLSQYIAYAWALSENTRLAGKASASEWQKLDNFVDRNFTTTIVSKRSCAYLKRFSPLQANLHSTDLNVAVLTDMAQAVINRKDYIASCSDASADLDNRNAAIQLDITIDDPQAWFVKGFDYWNSVKIYLSWAWRNASILDRYSPKYSSVFRSLALEESIMLIPNGCRSIMKPACDSEGLSINSLRELAKPNTPSPEHSKEIPSRLENNLLERGQRSVNNDFLGTRSYDTAAEWVENFRKQFIQNRGSMKNKFQSAVQFMNILADSMSAAELVEFTKPLALNRIADNNLRDELYYLCTESRLAGDKRLDFLRSDVDRIGQLTSMMKAAEFSPREITEFIAFFNTYIEGVMPLCESLEKQNIWNPGSGYTPNKAGFQTWAKELLNIQLVDESGKFIPPITYSYGAPLLVWKKDAVGADSNVICQSALDCGRKVVKSLVDLHAVSVYADAFLPVSSTAASPNVFNPYTELKACKIYDPWFQTRRAQKVFMSDLANTVLFGFNALPIYLDIDYSAAKVTSFNQLVKNGKIKFDPNIQASKMQAALVADFGALLGAPCAISIAPTSLKAPSVYAFDGISVNYCSAKQSEDAIVKKPNDVVPTTSGSRSYCGGCSLNFVSIATTVNNAPTGFNPLKGAIFLFRSIYKFVTGMKDPVNVPRLYTVNLNYVADTYKRYGKIPEQCVEQLGKGLKCFESVCAAKAAEHFEKLTGGEVVSIEVGSSFGNNDRMRENASKTAWIKSNICNGTVVMPFNCREGSDYFRGSYSGSWGGRGQCGEKF